MESWSPFMNAQILDDETLNQIGKVNNKSGGTSRHSFGTCNMVSSLFLNQLPQE